MITTKLANGRVFLHNGDFSGSLEINCTPDEVEELDRPPGEPRVMRVTVPFVDIRAIVAEYVRRTKVEALESADDDVTLGVPPGFGLGDDDD